MNKKKSAPKAKPNRFAHLDKELRDLKSGKTKLKVTTVDPVSKAMTVHFETYEEMHARHKAKAKAAAEFKRVRKELGLPQAAAAAALRVNLRTLQGWESGRFPINPTAEVLLRVMRAHPSIVRELSKKAA